MVSVVIHSIQAWWMNNKKQCISLIVQNHPFDWMAKRLIFDPFVESLLQTVIATIYILLFFRQRLLYFLFSCFSMIFLFPISQYTATKLSIAHASGKIWMHRKMKIRKNVWAKICRRILPPNSVVFAIQMGAMEQIQRNMDHNYRDSYC